MRRYLLAVAVGLVVLRLLGPSWRTGYPPPFPDSSSYVAVASLGPFHPGFWFAQRPPVYPLLIWLVGPSYRSVVVAQTLVAVMAWAWLWSTVWEQVRNRWVASVALVLLIAIAVETRWVFWNTAVLTESLSGSLAIAMITAWWRWWVQPGRFRLVAAVVLTSVWMLVRDSNAVSMVAVAAVASVVVVAMERRHPSPRRRGLALALSVVVATGAFSLAGQFHSDRGATSLHNDVGLRWLPDREMRAWATARGMPVDDALLARTGADAWADDQAFLVDPGLARYRQWAKGSGRLVAGASFVVKVDWYLQHYWEDLPSYTATDHLSYDTFHVAERFPERPLGPFDPTGSRPTVMISLAVLLAGSALLLARSRTLGWLAAFWTVPVVADLYLSYVSDAIEVGRHLVGPLQRLSVVTVLVTALAIDSLTGEVAA